MAAAVAALAAATPATPAPAGAAGAASGAAGLPVVRTDFPIRDLPRAAWPYVSAGAAPADHGRYDAAGAAVWTVAGRAYDHPVLQAQTVLDRLSDVGGHVAPQDLARARINADRLIERSRAAWGAMYFPYPFDFALHGDAADVMTAPWFSAMAQGQALSAFVRLYEATGEARYLAAARATFASFRHLRTNGTPWTVDVLPGGYLWFEEYAKWPGPDRAFNGHVFAIYGLYDFHRLTRDPRARLLFQAGVTAAAARLPVIRQRGRVSRYCLSHDWAYPEYHPLHVRQLIKLYDMTGALTFARWADRLLRDHPAAQGGGSAALAAGRHTGYRFDAQGRVLGRRDVALATGQTVAVDRRAGFPGRRGVWLRVAAGDLAGHWVRERAGRAHVAGAVERFAYDLPRPLALARGEHVGLRFGAGGAVVDRLRARLRHPARSRAAARATINGRLYAYVADGRWAGYWLPVGPAVAFAARRVGGTAAAGAGPA